jgi:DNA-binding PadR family transcriptional regulator
MNSSAELSSEIRKLIPLTPAVFFVLLSLASEAKHGYAVMQEVEHLSERLSDLNLVSEVPPPGAEEAGRRRYYEITSQGRGLLDVEVARMKNLVRRAHALLAIKPAGES